MGSLPLPGDDCAPPSAPTSVAGPAPSTVTVVVLARDAAATLSTCLRSLDGFPSVLVAVDARSSDETEKIAREFGSQILLLPWQGGFGAQRNAAASQAEHDWVLFVDADEELTPELSTEVINLLANRPERAAYSVPRRNNLLGRWMVAGGWWPDRQVRLVNRLEVEYTGAVHEHVELPEDQIGKLTAPLLHRTHASLEDVLARADTYSMLEATAAREEGLASPSKLSILVLPLAHFAWRYLLQLGFRDGRQGWVEAHAQAYYRYLSLVRRRNGPDVQAPAWMKRELASCYSRLAARGDGGAEEGWAAKLPQPSSLNPLAIGFALVLIALPFNLLLKRILPGYLGAGWKEMALAILACLALTRIRLHMIQPLCRSWVLRVVLLYVGLVAIRTVFGARTLADLDGLRIDVTYAAAVVIVLALPRSVGLWLLVRTTLVVASISACGALTEEVYGHALVPSSALVQQYGRAEVYIESTHILRPYFVFDFPTGLATYLAVAVVFAAALWLVDRRHWIIAVFALCATGLTLTFSRGPWLAAIAGLAVVATLASGRSVVLRLATVVAMGLLLLASTAITIPGTASASQTMHLRESPALRSLTRPPRIAQPLGSLLAHTPVVERKNLPPPGAPARTVWVIDGTREPVLAEPPPVRGQAILGFRVHVPSNAVLTWGIALDSRVWSPPHGDGVVFRLSVVDGAERDALFARYIDPKNIPADRRARYYAVPLYGFAGDTVTIDLSTSSGLRHDADFDWAGWLNPRLVRLPGYVDLDRSPYHPLSGVQIVRPISLTRPYLATMADWTGDQSNTDRLAAWHRTLAVWQRQPLFGLGPGSSDEAALRSGTATPIITESQLGKVLVETGGVGLLVWLALCCIVLWQAVALYRRERRVEHLAALGGLAAIMVAGLAFQVLEVKQIDMLFWTLVGIVAAGEVSALPGWNPLTQHVLATAPVVAPAISRVSDLPGSSAPPPEAVPVVAAVGIRDAGNEPGGFEPAKPVRRSLNTRGARLDIPEGLPFAVVSEVLVLNDHLVTNNHLDEGWLLLSTGVSAQGPVFVLGKSRDGSDDQQG